MIKIPTLKDEPCAGFCVREWWSLNPVDKPVTGYRRADGLTADELAAAQEELRAVYPGAVVYLSEHAQGRVMVEFTAPVSQETIEARRPLHEQSLLVQEEQQRGWDRDALQAIMGRNPELVAEAQELEARERAGEGAASDEPQ